jgi:hypothetical protein
MKFSTTAGRIPAAVALIAALGAVGGVGQAGASRPAGMSKGAYRSLVIRSEALDQKYRLGAWKTVPQGMSLAAYRALAIRSAALDKKYGAGAQHSAAVVRTPSVSTRGFSWSAFGIGAVAMLGLVLLATGVIAASRSTREAPRVRTS